MPWLINCKRKDAIFFLLLGLIPTLFLEMKQCQIIETSKRAGTPKIDQEYPRTWCIEGENHQCSIDLIYVPPLDGEQAYDESFKRMNMAGV
ncbi:MAG: hypothetical protein OIF54_09215 [Cohaesibacter sp.]|nr:hypothetical protein [Cohaesibacter sp.]